MEAQVDRRSLFRLAGLAPVAAATAIVLPKLPADLREDLSDARDGHIHDHEELAKRVNELLRLFR